MLLRRDGKIVRDAMTETGDLLGALRLLGELLDCPQPVLLGKHEREWVDFGKTTFRPDDFVETVDFDRLELDTLREPTKSKDPRNAGDR